MYITNVQLGHNTIHITNVDDIPNIFYIAEPVLFYNFFLLMQRG